MLSTSKQRAALVAATVLANASAQVVLVLVPVHLVLDLGLGPAAYGALAGVAACVFALAVPVGRYLTGRTPGRTVIIEPASFLATLAPNLLLTSTAPGPVAGAAVLGVAALGIGRPAWRALVEASAASGAAGSGAWWGRVAGLVLALVTTTGRNGVVVGVEVGSCLGLLGVFALVLVVEDERAPLPPRRSATVARCRRAVAVAAVRRTSGLGAWVAFTLVSGTAVLVAVLGPRPDPTALVGVLGLSGLAYAGIGQGLNARAEASVGDELQQSARAVVEHAALMGAAAAALVSGLFVQTWG